jgi:hypothetical protein
MRVIPVAAALAALIAAGCRSNFAITQDAAVPLAGYATLHVAPVVREGDWATDPKHGPYTEDGCRSMQDRVLAHAAQSGLFGEVANGEGGRDGVLVLRATLTQYDPGNRALRWLGAGGGGRLLTELAVHDGASGERLAAGQAWANVGGGAYGGDFDRAWPVCADGIWRFLYAVHVRSAR